TGGSGPWLDRNAALDLWLEAPAAEGGAPYEPGRRGSAARTRSPESGNLPFGMPSSRRTRRRRVERREVRSARRARRFALLTLLAIVLIVALALSAFGGGARPVEALAVGNIVASKQTKPFPQIVALHGVIRLQLPVVQGQATAIGYHSSSDGAISLKP